MFKDASDTHNSDIVNRAIAIQHNATFLDEI